MLSALVDFHLKRLLMRNHTLHKSWNTAGYSHILPSLDSKDGTFDFGNCAPAHCSCSMESTAPSWSLIPSETLEGELCRMDRHYRMCARCVMDTTDPDITFDENGFCNHCTRYFASLKKGPTPEEMQARLSRLVAKIKADGKGREYDCILGLSGGCDSSYCAFKVVELGLRPLTVHFDGGWNAENSPEH